jgi:hypothetical protein
VNAADAASYEKVFPFSSKVLEPYCGFQMYIQVYLEGAFGVSYSDPILRKIPPHVCLREREPYKMLLTIEDSNNYACTS